MFLALERITYDCDKPHCTSKVVEVEKRISKMPRQLVVVIMRYSADSRGNMSKRDDMVEIPMEVDFGKFTAGMGTVTPETWMARTCVRFAPPLQKPSSKKRRLDVSTAKEQVEPPKKKARTRRKKPPRNIVRRKNHEVSTDQVQRMVDLASEQRRLQQICGAGEADYGLLVAFFESLESSKKKKQIQREKNSADCPLPRDWVPLQGEVPCCNYLLRGSVQHLGESPHRGHYTARVLNGDTWQNHNDHMVLSLDSDDAVIFGEDECKTAYVLFFEWQDK